MNCPLDSQFAPYIIDSVTWLKYSQSAPKQGFTHDRSDAPETECRTAAQKVAMLELMLVQVANYCLIIARNMIV